MFIEIIRKSDDKVVNVFSALEWLNVVDDTTRELILSGTWSVQCSVQDFNKNSKDFYAEVVQK